MQRLVMLGMLVAGYGSVLGHGSAEVGGRHGAERPPTVIDGQIPVFTWDDRRPLERRK